MPAYYYYDFILQYGPLILLLAGVPNVRKLDSPLRLCLYYTALSLLMTIVMTVMALRKMNNIGLMNHSQPVELGLLLWMFQEWESEARIRRLIRSLIVPFLLVWFYEVVLSGRFSQFTTYARPVEGIILTFAACLTIYRVNKNLDEPFTDK